MVFDSSRPIEFSVGRAMLLATVVSVVGDLRLSVNVVQVAGIIAGVGEKGKFEMILS